MGTRELVDAHVKTISAWTGPRLTFMEVCGTHTMAIARFNLRELLPENIRLVSGPGCPVCVTPVGFVDHALALADLDGITITTFGDLMRVPGSEVQDDRDRTLIHARARGADVRVVYSPVEALDIAAREPERQVVFLGVGFETTAPGLAATVLRAAAEGVENFSLLCSAKTIPEALSVLAGSDDVALNGFICPGHVSAVIGCDPYRPMADRFGLACAIAGFEPVEILRGIASLVGQVTEGRPRVDNCYPGVVREQGNPRARQIMERVFEPSDAEWRGLGTIPKSGLRFRDALSHFDAGKRFPVDLPPPEEPRGCRCGDVLKGGIAPVDCALFGVVCTPDHPKGACMVSSEGACAASFHYRTEEDLS